MNKGSLKTNTIVFAIRQVVLFVLGFFVSMYITSKFESVDFGRLVLFNVTISTFGFFADGGLFIAFVQKRADITNSIMNKIFTFQLMLLGIVLIISMFFTIFDIWILLGLQYIYICFFIAGLNSIQSIFYIKLQKELNITAIAICDLASSIIYYVVVMIFVSSDFGIRGVIYATVVKSMTSVIIIYFLSPLQIRFEKFLNDQAFMKNIKDGVINQVSYVMGYIRSLLNPVIVGNILGASSVGLVDRAIFFAGIPAGIISAIVQKVYFPYFSKINENKEHSILRIKQSIFVTSIIDKFYYIPLLVLIDSVVHKFLGSKWDGLTVLIYIVSIGNMTFGGPSAIFNAVLLSLGKFKWNTALNLIQIALTWPVAWLLTRSFGIVGYIFISPLLWLFLIPVMVIIIRKFSGLKILYEMVYPTVIAMFVIGLMFLVRNVLIIDNLYVEILSYTFFSYSVFIGIILLTERQYVPALIVPIYKKIVRSKK